VLGAGSEGKACRYEPRSWVDACWFGDSKWFEQHIHLGLREYPGIIAHCVPKFLDKTAMVGYKRGKPAGIEARPTYVAWNGCSGSSAINFAYHLGARRVVLLGFDMRRVDGKTNWHNDHPSPDKNPYARFLQHYPRIAKDAEGLGLEIVNCTPGSAIDQFPIMTLEEYLTKEEKIGGDNGD